MSHEHLFQEVEEDLDRQRLEALWKKYGFLIITLAVGIVLWTASATAYRSWRADQAQKTTAAFLQASTADASKSMEALEKFAESHKGADLGALGLFRAGAVAADKGDRERAIRLFDQIAANAKADLVFRQLGDLLSIQLQLDTGDAAVLSKRLQPLTVESAPWRYSALEKEGLLAFRAGDKAKARQIFMDLSQDERAPQSISERASDFLRILE